MWKVPGKYPGKQKQLNSYKIWQLSMMIAEAKGWRTRQHIAFSVTFVKSWKNLWNPTIGTQILEPKYRTLNIGPQISAYQKKVRRLHFSSSFSPCVVVPIGRNFANFANFANPANLANFANLAIFSGLILLFQDFFLFFTWMPNSIAFDQHRH